MVSELLLDFWARISLFHSTKRALNKNVEVFSRTTFSNDNLVANSSQYLEVIEIFLKNRFILFEGFLKPCQRHTIFSQSIVNYLMALVSEHH
jgi:hypothetical protein